MAVLTSGGAKGVDSLFTEWASKVGDTVYNLSFDGHQTNCAGRFILNEQQLALANPFISQVAPLLNKRVPKEGFVKKLIQRNYFQIRKAELVIAIAPLTTDKKQVQGGTGWAVMMAIQNHTPVYVFDFSLEEEKAWFCYNDKTSCFEPSMIPNKSERYAGIGSRNVNTYGVKAIQNLYEFWHPFLMRK